MPMSAGPTPSTSRAITGMRKRYGKNSTFMTMVIRITASSVRCRRVYRSPTIRSTTILRLAAEARPAMFSLSDQTSAIETTEKPTTTTYPPTTSTWLIRTPASAGPTMALAFMPIESRATALVTPPLPTRSWIMERRVGSSSAHAEPTRVIVM